MVEKGECRVGLFAEAILRRGRKEKLHLNAAGNAAT
jgi:hypothetical protein